MVSIAEYTGFVTYTLFVLISIYATYRVCFTRNSQTNAIQLREQISGFLLTLAIIPLIAGLLGMTEYILRVINAKRNEQDDAYDSFVDHNLFFFLMDSSIQSNLFFSNWYMAFKYWETSMELPYAFKL